MTGRKGISVFTSHVIAIAILFVVLVAASSSLYSYYHSLKENVQESQALAVSRSVAEAVLALYSEYSSSEFVPQEGRNETLSEVYINVPEKISGNTYTLSLLQHEEFWIDVAMENETTYQNERPYTFVRVEADGMPSGVYEYPIYNIVGAKVSGSASQASTVKISYFRESKLGVIGDYITLERFR